MQVSISIEARQAKDGGVILLTSVADAYSAYYRRNHIEVCELDQQLSYAIQWALSETLEYRRLAPYEPLYVRMLMTGLDIDSNSVEEVKRRFAQTNQIVSMDVVLRKRGLS